MRFAPLAFSGFGLPLDPLLFLPFGSLPALIQVRRAQSSVGMKSAVCPTDGLVALLAAADRERATAAGGNVRRVSGGRNALLVLGATGVLLVQDRRACTRVSDARPRILLKPDRPADPQAGCYLVPFRTTAYRTSQVGTRA